MTYQELHGLIEKMSDEQKNCDVTVLDTNTEYFAVSNLDVNLYTDVLDSGHPYLKLDH